MYEDDYTAEEEEFAAGWEALQAQLANDESWAHHLWQEFHGQEV